MLHPLIVKILNDAPSSIMKPISKFIVNRYLNRYADINIINSEELNKINGPVIFVSNHLSNSDGLVLNKVLKKLSPMFVAGIKLSKNPVSRIGWEAVEIIPIHPNTADIESMKKCIEKIKEGRSIAIFPEGTRSRYGSLIEGKKGVILIAKKSGVPIIPIGLTGTEVLMPIDDNDMGKETFHRAKVTVNIGKQFYLPEKNKEDEKEDYNVKCLNTIMYNIAAQLPEKYRGVYK